MGTRSGPHLQLLDRGVCVGLVDLAVAIHVQGLVEQGRGLAPVDGDDALSGQTLQAYEDAA